jgi:hypothetical protein
MNTATDNELRRQSAKIADLERAVDRLVRINMRLVSALQSAEVCKSTGPLHVAGVALELTRFRIGIPERFEFGTNVLIDSQP